MKKGKTIIIIVITVVTVFTTIMAAMLLVCGSQKEEHEERNVPKQVSEMKTMPTVTGTYMDGEPVKENIWADHPFTLVNVWSTGCGPCLEELPDLQYISEKYAEDSIGVLGILADGESAKTDAYLLLQEANVEYPNVIPDEAFMESFVSGENAVPYSLIVNRDGEILHFIMGSQSRSEFEQTLDALLLKAESDQPES